MKQHIIVLLAASSFFGFNALAANPVSVREISPREGTHVMISGSEAAVTLIGSPQATTKITMDPATEALVDVVVTSEANGDFIQIRDKSSRPGLPANGKLADAKKSEGKTDPKNHVKIEISGHSVPVEIHVREGQVIAQKWQKEIYAHVQRGKIIARENSGSMIAHIQKGEVSITDHQGKVIIDDLQASTTVKDLKGDLDIQSFMGDVNLEKLSGAVSIIANQGNVKVVSGTGSLQFELQKASLSTSQFEGRVEGQSQEGNVSIQATKDPDINVKSQSGRVTVSTSAGSGALLNLSSAEGDVIVPAYLKVSRDGSVRSLRGRLKGETQKGSIFVRSQESVIVVK